MTDQPGPPAARLRVIDLETTGDSLASGGVVEVGWQDLACAAGGGWALQGHPGARLVQPGCAISAVTSAVHHIVDEDVAGAPSWDEAAPVGPRGGGHGGLAGTEERGGGKERR